MKLQLFRTAVCGVAALTVGVATVSSVAAKGTSGAKIEKIRVQLLYETTGTLSEDIAPPSKFAIWNAIIGEGSAKEPASDVLISAVLGGVKEEENSTQPLVLTVKNDKGKVLASRTFGNLLIGSHGLVKSVLLRDAACAGTITIEATYGGQKKKTSVGMACGE